MKEQFIEEMRKEYTKFGIDESKLAQNPFDQFESWFNDAKQSQILEANAVILSTANIKGRPSSRVVLIKHIDENGFRFFTNYQSNKGQDLEENPQASLLFFWPMLERQVHISGQVTKTDKKISEEYFHSRPKESQLGAWASSQSTPIASRNDLENKFTTYKTQFEGQEIPLPDHWGGYTLSPTQFEFWQGRTCRLHDRIAYTKQENNWTMERLCP